MSEDAGDCGARALVHSRRRLRILPAFVLAVLVALTLSSVAAAASPVPAGILVTDNFGSAVEGLFRVDPVTGVRTAVADRDDFILPYATGIYGLAIEPDGNVLVAAPGTDSRVGPGAEEGRVFRLDPVSGAVTHVYRSRACGCGLLTDPRDVGVAPNGDIVVLDWDFNFDYGGPYIVRIDRSTGAETIVSWEVSGPWPGGLAVEPTGGILVGSSSGLLRVDPVSGAKTTVSEIRGGGLALEPDGDILMIAAGKVVRVDPVTGAWTVVSSGGHLIRPTDLALEPDGDIVITDTGLLGTDDVPDGEVHFDGRLIRVDPATGAQTLLTPPCPDVGIFACRDAGYFDNAMGVAVCRPCATSLPVSGSGSYGGRATLTATLDSGSPAWSTAGKRIEFTLDGASVGTAVTNADGVAQLSGVSLGGRNAGTYSSAVGARFAGDIGYRPSAASGDLTVARVAGSVRIDNIPTDAVFGGSFTLAFAKAGDGVVAVTARTPGVCSVSTFGVVSFDAAGTCTLQASVREGTNHLAATGPEQSFVIAKAAGSVNIENIPSDAFFKGGFTPAYAKAGDGLICTSSKTPTVCSVSSGVVSFHMVGTCTLQASVTEGTNHLAATGPEQSFAVAGFTFTGFAAPISNGFVNGAKAGQAIPVKYRLSRPDGTPVSDPVSFTSLSSQSGGGLCAGLALDPIEAYASGDSGLRYLGDGNWQFNWKTPKDYAGQCRTMTLTLEDASTHTATFQFM